MADLIKVEHDDDKNSIIIRNILLLSLSCIALLNAVSDLEKGRLGHANLMMVIVAASAGLCDLSNKATKSQFALERLQHEAESRQKARVIKAQEDALAADLSVASNQRLTQLNLENAEINAELYNRMLELQHEHANLKAQLQEFE